MRFAAALLLLPLLAPPLRAQDAVKVRLEWKWTKDAVQRYESLTENNTEFAGGEMAQKMVFGLTQKVTAIDAEGTATVQATYDRVKVEMDIPMMGKTDYDSDRDKEAPADPIGKIMAGMVGKSITMTIESRGHIKKVEGVKAMVDAIVKNLDEESGAMMGERFAKQFTDDSMKQQMQQGFALLPKVEVGVGDTWVEAGEFPMAMMGKMTYKTKFTLKELRDGGGEAVIGLETTFAMEKGEEKPGAEEPAIPPFELTEGTSKGEIVWSIAKGSLVSSKSTSTMAMNAMGQEIATTTKAEMKAVAPK